MTRATRNGKCGWAWPVMGDTDVYMFQPDGAPRAVPVTQGELRLAKEPPVWLRVACVILLALAVVVVQLGWPAFLKACAGLAAVGAFAWAARKLK